MKENICLIVAIPAGEGELRPGEVPGGVQRPGLQTRGNQNHQTIKP